MSEILNPGTILWSRYRILDLVGQGWYGRHLNRDYAWKAACVLSKSYSGHGSF